MNVSTRTPEGEPQRCPVCGKALVIEPSRPADDATCPHCGSLVWFPLAFDFSQLPEFYHFEFADRSIRTKPEALGVVVDRLIEEGALPQAQRERVLRGLLKREGLRSTAVGDGIAMPHLAIDGIRGAIRAAARFAGGVEFDSLDRNRVTLVFLGITPAERPREHLRFLEDVSRFLRSV